jgi:hypothetical protein
MPAFPINNLLAPYQTKTTCGQSQGLQAGQQQLSRLRVASTSYTGNNNNNSSSWDKMGSTPASTRSLTSNQSAPYCRHHFYLMTGQQQGPLEHHFHRVSAPPSHTATLHGSPAPALPLGWGSVHLHLTQQQE